MNLPAPQHFVDSVQVPTPEQAKAIYDAGYRGWAANVAGDGVPPNELWPPADVKVVTDAGLAFLPIATVNWSIDQTGKDLAYLAVCAALACGVVGVIALDTEAEERGNPRVNPTVDGFVRSTEAMGWIANIYAGAAYFGSGRLWLPRWSAPSGTLGMRPSPPPGGAIQYAGDIVTGGVTVDLSVSGGLPFAATLPAVDAL